MKSRTSVKGFFFVQNKRNGSCQEQKGTWEVKFEKSKNRGACVSSPNLVADDAQLLRTVVTELPGFI